jgi:hypothetical protein
MKVRRCNEFAFVSPKELPGADSHLGAGLSIMVVDVFEDVLEAASWYFQWIDFGVAL